VLHGARLARDAASSTAAHGERHGEQATNGNPHVPDDEVDVPDDDMDVPDGPRAVPDDDMDVPDGPRAVPDGDRFVPDGRISCLRVALWVDCD
jgi:hypothetical protein